MRGAKQKEMGGGGETDRPEMNNLPFSNLKFQTSLFVWGGGGGGEDYSYIFMHT